MSTLRGMPRLADKLSHITASRAEVEDCPPLRRYRVSTSPLLHNLIYLNFLDRSYFSQTVRVINGYCIEGLALIGTDFMLGSVEGPYLSR